MNFGIDACSAMSLYTPLFAYGLMTMSGNRKPSP